MSVVIYNSLTKKKEPLDAEDGQSIKIYSCGVTVYDKCHIGHARSLYIFEVIRRYLKFRGYDVRFVRNITDIDDKIINKAQELGKDWKEVVDDNIKAYRQDLDRLGIPEADIEPRATENIDVMQDYIKGLIQKEYAYEVDGDVYFRVRNFKDYGKLSGQSIDAMQEAVRIDKDEKKEDPLDFALWKRSKEGEPFWPSPWGEGRPGWHIECSCMSQKHLDCQTLDIHAGGRDLIFPHHENEIAQAEAFTGKLFAKCWIHHGLLTINGQKMAKSLGNFVTIEDAVKDYGANGLKMFYLSSHYRSNIDFSDDKMEEAQKRFEQLALLMKDLKSEDLAIRGSVEVPLVQDFQAAMDDDFNTPKALGVLSEMIHWARKLLDSHDEDRKSKLHAAMTVIQQVAEIFGLEFLEDAPLNAREESLIDERAWARQNKDYRKSDEIRDKLKDMGIIVEDTPQGQKWRRK